MNRIHDNVTIDVNGCWNWQKSCNSAGYGQFTINGKYWTTHRYVYTKTFGEIPVDLVVRHKCHNTKCCNPDHLLIGTQKENWNDSKDVHLGNAKKLRKSWFIDGVSYSTVREASKSTGITQSTLIKHTKNGIFDVLSYRQACSIANVVPKI